MTFKNEWTQGAFYEWWGQDWWQDIIKRRTLDDDIMWIVKVAFEYGVNAAQSHISKYMSDITSTTTEKLD